MNVLLKTCLFLIVPQLLYFISCCENECIQLPITITQKIENQGFHRNINWLIASNTPNAEAWLEASCNLSLQLTVDKTMFVIPDQIEDLNRLGKLDVRVAGPVDVEAIAHEATNHMVFIYLNSSQLLGKIHVNLPIHLRYQKSFLGGHSKAHLNKPLFLVHCPISNDIICGENSTVSAPASSEDFDSIQVWKNLSYVANFEDIDLLVPVGNLNHYPYVAVLTCILGCVGCIYIISLLSN